MNSAASLPITLENFQQVILEESKARLVLIAFYADQMPESVELKTKLEALTANASETILMASVDCQAQQQIAQQFGLQSLPTAVLIKDGQPIDGIGGPQTDETIAEFLNKHLPKPEDTLLSAAKTALAEQDFNVAFQSANEAAQIDSERGDIKLVLADACLGLSKVEDAKALLETIKMVDQDSYYQSLISKLELALDAASSPELVALEQQVKAEPENVELIQQLAVQYNQAGRQEEALALIFSQVQKDGSDAKSKDIMLDIMKALPDGDPLAGKYRRKLYAMMY